MNALPSSPLYKISSFEGPLDLLLHLIRANQVDISDIPIVEITRQYLQYSSLFETLDLAIAGEYVLMAATLIEIKSRLLLPKMQVTHGEESEEDPRAELAARLREYEQYQGTVETFRQWEEMRRLLYFRGALENADDYILPIAAGEASPIQLYQALHRVLMNAGVADESVTAVTPKRRLSLRMKMAEIVRKLNAAYPESMNFENLFELPCPKYDIVLTFLATLELLRLFRVKVTQESPLEEILMMIVKQENNVKNEVGIAVDAVA